MLMMSLDQQWSPEAHPGGSGVAVVVPSTVTRFHSGLWRFQVPVTSPVPQSILFPSIEDVFERLRTERLDSLYPVLAPSKSTSLLPNSVVTVEYFLSVFLEVCLN